MKIMFVSDIHGNIFCLQRIKEIYNIEKPNKIIFLGDYYSFTSFEDINDILLTFSNSYFIRGNCDSETDVYTAPFHFLDSLSLNEYNKKIYCSHGNRYNIDRLPEEEFDILVYGHTHQGMIKKDNNKYFINPGSCSYPRGGTVNSYAIIDENGIYLKDLEENVIEKIMW